MLPPPTSRFCLRSHHVSFHTELLDQTQRERAALVSIPIIQSALGGHIARDDYIAFL